MKLICSLRTECCSNHAYRIKWPVESLGPDLVYRTKPFTVSDISVIIVFRTLFSATSRKTNQRKLFRQWFYTDSHQPIGVCFYSFEFQLKNYVSGLVFISLDVSGSNYGIQSCVWLWRLLHSVLSNIQDAELKTVKSCHALATFLEIWH